MKVEDKIKWEVNGKVKYVMIGKIKVARKIALNFILFGRIRYFLGHIRIEMKCIPTNPIYNSHILKHVEDVSLQTQF